MSREPTRRIGVVVQPSTGGGYDPTLAPVLAPLVEALIDAGQQHLGAMAQLQQSVCAYVAVMRREGHSLASIVAAVRALVGDLRDTGAMVAAEPGDPLLEHVIGWCGDQ